MNISRYEELLKCYEVRKVFEGYEIESEEGKIAAHISFDLEVNYFVTNVWGEGMDWEGINIEELDKLRKICVYIVNNERFLMREENKNGSIN